MAGESSLLPISMMLFYISTAIVMIGLLCGAFVNFLRSEKNGNDRWLGLFLASLILNSIWALVLPIVSGWSESFVITTVMGVSGRVFSLAGYICLAFYS